MSTLRAYRRILNLFDYSCPSAPTVHGTNLQPATSGVIDSMNQLAHCPEPTYACHKEARHIELEPAKNQKSSAFVQHEHPLKIFGPAPAAPYVRFGPVFFRPINNPPVRPQSRRSLA